MSKTRALLQRIRLSVAIWLLNICLESSFELFNWSWCHYKAQKVVSRRRAGYRERSVTELGPRSRNNNLIMCKRMKRRTMLNSGCIATVTATYGGAGPSIAFRTSLCGTTATQNNNMIKRKRSLNKTKKIKDHRSDIAKNLECRLYSHVRLTLGELRIVYILAYK